jgi:hypothetical protein
MAEATPTLLGSKAVEQLQKTVRETARRMRNEGPHRARWHGRPQTEEGLIEGLVTACIGRGWYEVELAEWQAEPRVAGQSGSNDPGDDCNACEQAAIVPDEIDGCITREVTIDYDRPDGLGVLVYAHDARRIPLRVGGHVRMLKTHINSEGEQLYAVVSGEYRLLAIADPDYECCDGQVVQTGCKFYLVEGVECPISQTDCPS